jgi:uncharacterized delta-60 repeat protein
MVDAVTFGCTLGGLPMHPRQFNRDHMKTRMRRSDVRGAPFPGQLRLVAVCITAAVGCLAQSPTVDSFNPGADNDVYAMAVQVDDKIFLGGYFLSLGGHACSYLGRLDAQGTFDTSFNAGVDYAVGCLAVQDDGKIVVGGEFSTLNGQPRLRIGRLNPDGSLDVAFNPGVGGNVSCLAVQPDGKVLVGGHFTTLGGQPRNNIGRLNADGTLDTTFNPGATKASYTLVNSLALQPDGKILVGGSFTSLGGQARTNMGRLNDDGSLDADFDPGAGDFYSGVAAIAVQSDGKILVGGGFSTLDGQSVTNIGRLDRDGMLDPGFNSRADSGVVSLALQADGKIVVGGDFTNLAGATRTLIGRLNGDGTVDPTFNPAASGGSYSYMGPYVSSMALQADGNILLGGRFTTLAGQTRTNIGRLVNTESATQSLAFDGSSITWLRGGTSPEVWRTRFDASTNGIDWFNLDSAARIPGGWQVGGLALPTNATIRVRGFLTGGYGNSSSWSVENIVGPPAVIQGPENRTNNAGTLATFSAQAGGSGVLSYQWCKDGASLTNGGNVFGVQTPTLTLTNVLGADDGGYSVVISTTWGSVTSLVARLSVVDPFIISSPPNKSVNQGQTVTLTATAAGTAPLSYQWRQNGVSLPGATTASMTLTNAQGTNVGVYDVVVSNTFGTVTSAESVLTVNLVDADQWNTGANYVDSLVILTNGKIVVSGLFTTVQGVPCNYLARLNPDGSLDENLWTLNNNCIADSLIALPDGKLVMGGDITSTPGERVRRLFPDGTRETAFAPGAGYAVACVTMQPDGKFLVGGSFTTLGGQTRNSIGRLNADGSLDTTFNPGANAYVLSLVLQLDGKILVGGTFTNLAGQPRNCIGRLNADGTLDASFNPGASRISDQAVETMSVQADGKILVGGRFTTLGGEPHSNFGRLSADGTIDSTFNPAVEGPSAAVWCILLQADGRIILGGYFGTVNGQVRTNIARLHPDGTLDLTFNPGAPVTSGESYRLAMQVDGKILIAGIQRLNNTEPATQSLTVDGLGVSWFRGGSSPEVWRTTFESSTNGLDWTYLGVGTRRSGGWQSTGDFVATNATIRARGYVTGGVGNRSSWYVESIVTADPRTPPAILVDDASFGINSNRFGFNIGALAGQVVVLESSTNLVNWTALSTNGFTTGPIFFADPDSENFHWRFYRARLLP